MGNFIEEHGEALIYGIIGVLVVVLICFICDNKWSKITPDYKNNNSKNSGNFISINTNKYPIINASDIVYADYMDSSFDIKKYISAKDYSGKDITEDIDIVGSVNVSRKGVYRLKLVVVGTNELTANKYINVIVE